MTVPATAPTGALTPSDVDGAAWARLRSLAVEAMGRAYASARPGWSTTGAWCRAAMWRTPATG